MCMDCCLILESSINSNYITSTKVKPSQTIDELSDDTTLDHFVEKILARMSKLYENNFILHPKTLVLNTLRTFYDWLKNVWRIPLVSSVISSITRTSMSVYLNIYSREILNLFSIAFNLLWKIVNVHEPLFNSGIERIQKQNPSCTERTEIHSL